MAAFILGCTQYADVGNGLMNTQTGKLVAKVPDVEGKPGDPEIMAMQGVVWDTVCTVSHRLHKIPGPIAIYANVSQLDEDAIIQSRNLGPELKTAFEVVSKVGWESRFKRLGHPTFFFDEPFRRTVRLDVEERSFGILTEWVLKRGTVITHSFLLQRTAVPDLLEYMSALLSGAGLDDFFGTAFLGALFEFDADFSQACKYEPAETFVLTLFLDPEASTEQLGMVAGLLNIVETEPMELHSRLLMEDVIDERMTAGLPCAWFMTWTGLEEGGPKAFSDYYHWEHYMSWTRLEVLPGITLQTALSFQDIGKEPAMVSVSCPEELVMEFLFAKEPFNNLLAEDGLFTLFNKITFEREEGTEGIKISYRVTSHAKVERLRSVLEARMLGLQLKAEYGLDVMSRMDIQVSVGSFTGPAENYAALQESMKEWPKSLKPSDLLSFFKTGKPRKGQVRAYQLVLETATVKSFFIKCLQYLSGSQGGFWMHNTLGLILRKQKGPDDADWEAIWLVDEAAPNSNSHTDYLTLFGKLLLLCECRSPFYAYGRYNFGTARFEATRRIEELVDDYYDRFLQAFSLHLPPWLLEERQAALAERLALKALMAEQEAALAMSIMLLKEAQHQQCQLEHTAMSVDLEIESNAVDKLQMVLAARKDSVKEHELAVREEEMKYEKAEAKVRELQNEEAKLEALIQELLRQELDFKTQIKVIEENVMEEVLSTKAVPPEAVVEIPSADPVPSVPMHIELSPQGPVHAPAVLTVSRIAAPRQTTRGQRARPSAQAYTQSYFK